MKKFTKASQIDFGRIAAQSAKQVISSRVREAEKNRQYEDFIDKQGQILSGIIKRLEYGNVIIDLGKAEGVIKKMSWYLERFWKQAIGQSILLRS